MEHPNNKHHSSKAAKETHALLIEIQCQMIHMKSLPFRV